MSNGEEEMMFLRFMGKIHTQSPLFHQYPTKGAPEKSSLEGKIHRVEFLVSKMTSQTSAVSNDTVG